MPYGRFQTDYGEQVDFERLKRERIEKAKKAIAKYELDAVLCFASENCRYLTCGPGQVFSGSGTSAFGRYVLYPINDEPILYEVGMIQKAIQLGIPTVKSKCSVPLSAGLVPTNMSAYNFQLGKFVAQIKAGLKE